MKKSIPFRPVFLAMLLGVVLVGVIQSVVQFLGGMELGLTIEGEMGLFDWLFLGLMIGFVFLLYLGPPALLIRWLVERWTGVRAPLLRTALTFLTSFVLLALVFFALALLFSLDSFGRGVAEALITSAYIALGSAIAAWWFISENSGESENRTEEDKD